MKLTTPLLPLGAIVRHGMREAFISGASHCDPPKYHVTYTDDGSWRDQLTPNELAVLCHNPADDERAPPHLRKWIADGRPAIDSSPRPRTA